MGDFLRKPHAGEPFRPSAGLTREMIDAIQWVKGQRRREGAGRTFGGRDHGTILVKNDSGADRAQFDVLGLGDPVISPDDNEAEFKARVAMTGDTPAHPDHLAKFGILLEPIADGKLGWACVAGVCPARISIQDADNHFFADIADGDATQLESKGGGAAQILWSETGTSGTLAVVRLGPPAASEFWGVLDDALVDITQDTSATFSIYDIYPSSDTGRNIEVWAPPVHRSGTVALGKWGRAKWDYRSDRFLFHPTEC